MKQNLLFGLRVLGIFRRMRCLQQSFRSWCCGRIPTFPSTLLPAAWSEDMKLWFLPRF